MTEATTTLTRADGERVLEVDHLFQAGTEKVVGHGGPQRSISLTFRCPLFQFLRVFDVHNSMIFHTPCGLQGFGRADALDADIPY
jgi:hypothetical protein